VIKKRRKVALLILLLSIIILVGAPRVIMVHGAQKRTFNTENVPADKAAIVFGAGLMVDGSPTSVLKDRVATAADLYNSGKINKILMSGDNRFLNYNEPGAMKSYALELGIPEEDIVLDYPDGGHMIPATGPRKSFNYPRRSLLLNNFICHALCIPAMPLVWNL